MVDKPRDIGQTSLFERTPQFLPKFGIFTIFRVIAFFTVDSHPSGLVVSEGVGMIEGARVHPNPLGMALFPRDFDGT